MSIPLDFRRKDHAQTGRKTDSVWSIVFIRRKQKART
ncbi:hypothetical protein EVA_12046 [gut metagenome]|uniref:Uncharacterized protein n=1 Tax=gut metagenome TaxID=749906 RepID=J9GDJ7_9ZZZZ